MGVGCPWHRHSCLCMWPTVAVVILSGVARVRLFPRFSRARDTVEGPLLDLAANSAYTVGPRMVRLRVRELHQHLPGVFALQHANQRARRILESVHDVLAIFQLAFFDPLGHLRHALRITLHELRDDETFGPALFAQQKNVWTHAQLGLGRVVLRNLPAHRNPRPYIQYWKYSIGNAPADVVEIAIDALRAKLFQLGRVVLRGLVIESAVKAQLASQPRDLLIAAGHANRAATFDLRDLPDKRAHGSRRSRDNHCLARLRLA